MLGRRLAALLIVAFASIATLVTVIVPSIAPLHRSAIWAVVLLVSFAGWGSGVAHFAFRSQRPDLGLRLVWGMAIVTAIGGLTCVLSVATAAVLLTLVLLGVALACVAMLGAGEHGQRRSPRSFWDGLAVVLVAVPATVQLYGGAAGAGLSVADDYTAYLVFPKKILDAGTLIEPFSLRRMSSYGGQSLFQALSLLGSDNALQVPVFDVGICLIVVLALIIGDRSGAAPAWAWLPSVALVLTLPPVQINSTSQMSGLVFFLGLYRTASWAGFDLHARRHTSVLGLLGAAAASLRHSYLVPAGLFLVLFCVPDLRRALRSARPAPWRGFAVFLAAPIAMGLFLAPWIVLSWWSNATPLFPLFAGNYRTEYGALTAANPVLNRAAWFWMNVRFAWPIHTIAAFVLAALLIPWHRTRGALVALTLASLGGFAAIVNAFPLSTTLHLSRYYFAFLSATAIAVSMHVWVRGTTDEARTGRQLLVARGVVLGAIVLQVWWVAPLSYSFVYPFYTNLRREAAREPSLLRDRGAQYRALQAAVPAHAPLIAMLDEPFWLDFRRNPIALLDLPGQVSPPPGMPTDDDNALVDYLRTQGFRYLAFVRPTKSIDLYQRSKWELAIRRSELNYGDQLATSYIWQKSAPRYLQFFDRLDALLSSRAPLYDDGVMVLLDLDRPAEDSAW